MLICNKCGNATRVNFRLLDDGKKVRVCNSCREVID
jgi:large subunit ribosomal protein L24